MALVVAVAAVVAWRALPRAAEVVEPAVVVVQPVLERGERRAAVVEESQRPEDPWTKKNKQAIGLLGEGELERAVALFRECVAAVPGEAVFRSNLAEALARLARVEYELVATRARDRALGRGAAAGARARGPGGALGEVDRDGGGGG